MNIKEYINSGLLEMYVLGIADEKECLEIEALALNNSEIKSEIREIEISLEKHAEINGIVPHPAMKTMLMATIDYTERLQNGELQSFPPVLNANSKIEDYSQWLIRKDMAVPEDFEGMFAKIIGYTAEVTSAIVWIKSIAPDEVHKKEYERFLIVEGTCDIIVDEKINQLFPGDYFEIPLFSDHRVIVTSPMPCKVILQRVAA